MDKFCWYGKPAYRGNRCEKHYQQNRRQKQKVKVPRSIRRMRRKKK
jgi:hypothetical protein